ncbi:MAG: response regulator [Chloroflexota bacterium]|nr:response regulator [Chloroflexota bacterium]
MNNQGNIRVLVAEDDYLVGEMIKGLLEDSGYAVVGEATTGLEVIEMVQSLRPDVVLMDIKMPDMDGIEATRLIYERCPTPVVVLTAYETEVLVEGATEAGVGAYLIKPPNAREIERAITISLARFDDIVKLCAHAELLEQQVQERTAEIQAKCAWLEAILNSVSDGIVVTDEQGEIIQTNPVAQTWLTQTLSPEEATRLQEAMQNLVGQASEHPETVLELTGLDLELSASPILEPGMEKAAAVVDIHDVSHLKALDRMRSRFIGNISHELRTPITTLKLSLALMRKAPLEKWKGYLDIFTQEVDWLARLVQDILQISHVDTGRLMIKPCSTSLNELAQESITNCQAQAQEQGLMLVCCLAEPEPVALVDPDRMTQTLDKLLRNAILYTPQGGEVVLSTGTEEVERRVWATVTVSDTGIGIPEEELPHVFERFFRGERPRAMQISGTGLGLAFVKEMVELHGGWVTLDSEFDVGTTVTIRLPLAEEHSGDSSHSSPTLDG